MLELFPHLNVIREGGEETDGTGHVLHISHRSQHVSHDDLVPVLWPLIAHDKHSSGAHGVSNVVKAVLAYFGLSVGLCQILFTCNPQCKILTSGPGDIINHGWDVIGSELVMAER